MIYVHSDYWLAVTLAGKLDPGPGELTRLRGLLAGLEPGTLYDAILASKVYTIARANLRLLPRQHTSDEVLTRLDTLQDEEEKRRIAALPETLAVLEHAAGSQARLIKGLPLREKYAEPDLRHLGDIDVQVARWDLAARLAGWLRNRGWLWDTDELPWLKWTEDGYIYGQLSLVFPENTDPITRVDLHIGPFSVAHAGLMPLAGWERGDVLGVSSWVPNPETAIALIAAHAVNDGILSMKDINDLHVLRAGQPEPDWISVTELARSAGAAPALRQLLGETERVYAGLGDAARPQPGYLAEAAETATARSRRVARFTYRDERGRGAGPLRSARLARQARRYYSAPLKPRLGGPPAGDGPLRQRGRNVCWRLVPEDIWRGLGRSDAGRASGGPAVLTEIPLGYGLDLVRSGDGAVMRVNGEIFVPTVWGPVTSESAALAAHVRGPR